MSPLTTTERDLIAKAIVNTRVSVFTDPERLKLVQLVGRLSERWDRTRSAFNLLPVTVKRQQRRQGRGP